MSENLRLSVSKCKTFLNCKKQFNFSYIQKLPSKEFSFHLLGKFCHKILEDYHNAYVNGSTEPCNMVMNRAFKDAVSFYKNMTKEMKKECWDILNEYLKIVVNDKKNKLAANVIACEKNFEIDLGDNVILNGMIDRVQIDADNIIHVCDYKTTKDKRYLENDFFQLLTYAYVILNEDPSIKKIRASYILLRHKFEYITTEFSTEDILEIKDKYIGYANQILSEKNWAPNPTRLCKYCSFLEHCTEGKKEVGPISIFGEVAW